MGFLGDLGDWLAANLSDMIDFGKAWDNFQRGTKWVASRATAGLDIAADALAQGVGNAREEVRRSTLEVKMDINGNASPELKEEIAKEVRGVLHGELTQAQLAAAG